MEAMRNGAINTIMPCPPTHPFSRRMFAATPCALMRIVIRVMRERVNVKSKHCGGMGRKGLSRTRQTCWLLII